MPAYTLTVTPEQARVIDKACDLLSRLSMGQLDEVASSVYAGLMPVDRYLDLRDGLEALRPLATGLPSARAYHGIASREIPDEARVAHDLHQVIRQVLAFARNPAGGWTVDYDRPMKYGAEPLATMGVVVGDYAEPPAEQ